MATYETDDEVRAVVKGFEQCTTDKDAFSHVSHLTVATFYLRDLSPGDAFQKMRTGLLRFLNHHSIPVEKYSDEITLEWLQRIQEVLAELDPRAPLVTQVNAVIDRLADCRIVRNSDRGRPASNAPKARRS